MNIRQAILAAADHIERNPKGFDWYSVNVPRATTCRTPGCALGWIGSFIGACDFRQVGKTLGVDALDFYSRMRDICDHLEWTRSNIKCAATLRLYADKYHPAPVENFARSLMERLAKTPAIAGDA